jgi:hypothetical protein
MSLSSKYGIPEEKIKALIKDGWISCTATKYEEVVFIYKRSISEGKPKLQAIADAAENTRLKERQVYNIIHRFDL